MSLILAVLFSISVATPPSSAGMLVSTEWLAAHHGDANVIIVEIGERSDYYKAHIPGARFIATDQLVTDRADIPDELPPVPALEDAFGKAGIGNEGRIVIYSRQPLLATRAWFTLDYLGHGAQTSLLDGGYAKWRAEGRALTGIAINAAPVQFRAAPDPSKLVSLNQMRELVGTTGSGPGRFVLIDARPPDEFKGRLRSVGAASAGHIPGARCIPWADNLTGGAVPVFRSPEDLREMYLMFGVTRDASVVAYCRSGMEATMTYFALRYLGYEAALYDGSFVEWSKDPVNQVATTQ